MYPPRDHISYNSRASNIVVFGADYDDMSLVLPPTTATQQGIKRPSHLEIAQALALVREITSQVFSGPFECNEKEDCEIAGDRFFEVRVVDPGEIGAILTRDEEWHRRVASLPASLVGLFRLAIDARE
jgi:hypothetical protein